MTAPSTAAIHQLSAVYVVKDGQVITLPFIEFTPKYVKFDTGTRDSALPWCAYADRQAFEAGEPALILAGPARLSMRRAFRTREAAEDWLARGAVSPTLDT
jgi:hypothetical protein